MKNKLRLKILDRCAFSALMLFEHFLGARKWKIHQTLKTNFLRSIQSKSFESTEKKAILIDRIKNLTSDQFHRDYFNKSIPVVFEEAAKDWNCTKKWDLDYFKMGFGEQDVLLVNANGLTSRNEHSHYEFLSVKELIENIKEGGNKYLRFSPLLENNPALMSDLDMNWLKKMRGSKTFASTTYMFLGGAGQKTLLHTDQPCNIYVQIHGRKKWTLFFPQETAFLYPVVSNTAYIKSLVDVDSPNDELYPLFKYAQAYEVYLNPGDVLYVPPHTWHFVENLSDSIAVGYRFSFLKAAFKSSKTLSLLRLLSTNPPFWKTIEYGKIDTNLIWAHAGGTIKKLWQDYEKRKKGKALDDQTTKAD